MRAVIVQYKMDGKVGPDTLIDAVQEANELLMAMAGLTLPNDAALQNVQRCEEGRGAMSFVIVCWLSGRPERGGRMGWVLSFSSTQSTIALCGGFR